MIRHHRLAVVTVVIALALDAVFGTLFAYAQGIPVWHGLYCGLANAVTVGGDVQPSTPVGYIVTACECVLVVPLFAATFSLFTSGLSALVSLASEDRIKAHVETRLKHHLGKP